MVTPEQHAAFREQGYLHLPGALGGEVVRPVREHLQAELKKQGIWSGGRTLSRSLKDVPLFQQVGKLAQLVRCSSLDTRLLTRELRSVMRQLAGVPLTFAEAQLLLTLPQQRAEWTLQGLNWHRDVSLSATLPGVQAFFLLDDLGARGGATLALAGSHRLDNAQGRQALDALVTEREMRVTRAGVELFILEMTGRAGDVYLMDMRLLHSPSINAAKQVRMMATVRGLTAQGT